MMVKIAFLFFSLAFAGPLLAFPVSEISLIGRGLPLEEQLKIAQNVGQPIKDISKLLTFPGQGRGRLLVPCGSKEKSLLVVAFLEKEIKFSCEPAQETRKDLGLWVIVKKEGTSFGKIEGPGWDLLKPDETLGAKEAYISGQGIISSPFFSGGDLDFSSLLEELPSLEEVAFLKDNNPRVKLASFSTTNLSEILSIFRPQGSLNYSSFNFWPWFRNLLWDSCPSLFWAWYIQPWLPEKVSFFSFLSFPDLQGFRFFVRFNGVTVAGFSPWHTPPPTPPVPPTPPPTPPVPPTPVPEPATIFLVGGALGFLYFWKLFRSK